MMNATLYSIISFIGRQHARQVNFNIDSTGKIGMIRRFTIQEKRTV
jgi:hypothetical protein